MPTHTQISTVCGSNITIAGLTNAIAPDGHMDVGSAFFKDVCGVESGGTWDNTRKELVLIVSQDIEADTAVVVTFEVKNPATPQSCPQIVLYTHGLHNEAHQAVMSQDKGTSCAMHVCSAGLNAVYAVQKSSVPCDDNIVCLTFSLNASLVHDCSPVLTLSGLPSGTSFESTFSGRVPESVFPAAFTRTSTSTFLTVAPVDGLAAHTNFTLCLINDECARTHASLSLEINFNDQVVVDTANNDSNYRHCVPRSGIVFPKLLATTQVQLQRSVGNHTCDCQGASSCSNMTLAAMVRTCWDPHVGMLGSMFTRKFQKPPPANFDDLRPFLVRADEYVVVSMVQSSAVPCDHGNTISTIISSPRDVMYKGLCATKYLYIEIPLCNATSLLPITSSSPLFPDNATYSPATAGLTGNVLNIPLQASMVALQNYRLGTDLLFQPSVRASRICMRVCMGAGQFVHVQ